MDQSMSFSPQSRGRSQTFSVDIAAHTLSPRSRGRARGISADNAAPTPGRSIKVFSTVIFHSIEKNIIYFYL